MYQISLQQFEGPLDLLLFFIKRDEINIYDIPIARIADEFLEYVRFLEQVDLDGVGDFIYMASLLINIKARMLLPSSNEDEDGEPVDPRRELVERLLEYVRFKEAAQQLEEQQEHRAEHFTRGAASTPEEDFDEAPELALDAGIFDLVGALRSILTDPPETPDPVHAVESFDYTIEEQQEYVLGRIASGDRLSFRRLVARQSRAFLIATFLAILELARQRYLTIYTPEAKRDFFVERTVPTDEADVSALNQNGHPRTP